MPGRSVGKLMERDRIRNALKGHLQPRQRGRRGRRGSRRTDDGREVFAPVSTSAPPPLPETPVSTTAIALPPPSTDVSSEDEDTRTLRAYPYRWLTPP
jgi:hypothetical protein